MRDPLATCFSCFTTDLGGRACLHTRFSDARRVFPALPGSHASLGQCASRHHLDNRYENLVSNAEGSVRKLLEAARLPWDPACLSFHRSHRRRPDRELCGRSRADPFAQCRNVARLRGLSWTAQDGARRAVTTSGERRRLTRVGNCALARSLRNGQSTQPIRILALGRDTWRASSFSAATVFAAGRPACTSRSRGHDVIIVDNLSRRKIDVELEVESLTPIRPISERLAAWKEIDRPRHPLRALHGRRELSPPAHADPRGKAGRHHPFRRAARRALFDEIVVAQALHRQQQPERHQRRALRHRRIAAWTCISSISARWASTATAPPA